MDGHGEPSPATAETSMEDLYAWVNEAEPGFEMLFDALFGALPAVEGVESRTEVISGRRRQRHQPLHPPAIRR